MITAGIDVGAKNVKMVILKDNDVIAKSTAMMGLDQEKGINEAFENALTESGLKKEEIDHITATGAGRKIVPFANSDVTDVTSSARGANFINPKARTVIDVGAEEGRAIKSSPEGKVIDFAINEKCAAGAGAFTEAMARALEVELEEFGNISLKSDKSINMNAQCTVFAESEVVSLVHSEATKEDIAKAVHDAMASRIVSMVRKIGLEEDIVFIGGVAKNKGFINSLKTELEIDNLFVPEEPEYVSALGAALIAVIKNQRS